MKIAIATDDFLSVTGHVGRCNGFLIFTIVDNKIISTEKRENSFKNHNHQHHKENHGSHSHTNLISSLSDCETLICTAAGWRLQEDFNNAGKELIFTNEKLAETAVNKFLSGSLEINESGVCRSH